MVVVEFTMVEFVLESPKMVFIISTMLEPVMLELVVLEPVVLEVEPTVVVFVMSVSTSSTPASYGTYIMTALLFFTKSDSFSTS